MTKHETFIPTIGDAEKFADFALCNTENGDTFLRALNESAHDWLLEHGRGVSC